MVDKNKNKVNEPISKDKEEEMSSALIAQLLAQDSMAQGGDNYYAEYSNDARQYDPYHVRDEFDDSYEENSEDDFTPKKKANTKNAAKRGKKRKAPATSVTKAKESQEITKESPEITKSSMQENSIANEEPTNKENDQITEQKVSKKRKRPVTEGCNTGVYTELEEKNFVEALVLFGRDWAKVQAHIGTRDGNSIRSHAQKHFIKLYRDQVPLPDKIRESGEGYTLSGKPLDPNSSAAKPYLYRGSQATSNIKKPIATLDGKEGSGTDRAESTLTGGVPQTTPSIPDITSSVETQTEALRINDIKDIQKETKTKKTKSATPSPSSSSKTNDSTAYDAKGRTTYSTSRLRSQRNSPSINYGQISKDEDPLTLVKCESFIGKPGSNTSGCQPFQISVDSNVLLAMDFHSHLMTTEIIGFLAGEWDKENKRMSILEAFPCRSIETGQNDVNVEMDPNSAIEVRHLIEERNLKVVGWYHSHPTFVPDPSLVDIENQRNYQTLCRDDHEHNGPVPSSTVEPFVGAIVGPYDPALPGSSSVINWFHVSNINQSERPIPRRLLYDLKENESLSTDLSDRLFDLLETYKESSEKVKFAEYWRQDAVECKLEKIIKSLGSRMPWVQRQLKEDSANVDLFLTRVQSRLKDW